MKSSNRPTSITVISWLFIIASIISVISTISILATNDPMTLELMKLNKLPINIQYIMMFLGLLVMLMSGIGMLKGKNWARFLYVIWTGIGIIVGLTTSPIKTAMIPGIIIFIIVIILLFQPKANKFFN